MIHVGKIPPPYSDNLINTCAATNVHVYVYMFTYYAQGMCSSNNQYRARINVA